MNEYKTGDIICDRTLVEWTVFIQHDDLVLAFQRDPMKIGVFDVRNVTKGTREEVFASQRSKEVYEFDFTNENPSPT
jgi:hypothetical protein